MKPRLFGPTIQNPDYMKGENGYHKKAYSGMVHNDVQEAADVVHEGTHVAIGGDEREAYRAQSYTSEAGHSYDNAGVWNPSWAAGPDREKIEQQRTSAIDSAAQRSEELTKMFLQRK